MDGKTLGKFSLWKKFAVALFGYAFLILIVTLSISYIRSGITTTKDLTTKANTMLQLAALASVDPFWNYNTAALIANGDALLKDDEISIVELTDSGGTALYKKAKDARFTSNLIMVEKDIIKEDKNIGKIKLGFTNYYRQQTIFRDLTENIIWTTLLAFFLGILFTYFISRSITTPINKIVSILNQGANQTASASNQLAATSQQLSQGSASQASAIEETSSTLQEASTMIQQNNANIKQATQLSEHTKEAAEKGNSEMEEMISAITEVKKSSDRIAKVIKVIDDIAFQTNILALNAAVEAARAGEAGSGFAVVAEEVRNLAGRSAQSAKDTSAMIEANIELSANGVLVTERVKDTLNEITIQTKKVSQLMDEIAAASLEQALGIEQVNKTTIQMESITQQNAANAEESAATSVELSNQAQNLRNIVRQLSELVNGKIDRNLLEQSIDLENHQNQAVALADTTLNKSNTRLIEHSLKTKVISPEKVIPLDQESNF